MTQNKGVSVTANSHDSSIEYRMTQNSEPAYSPMSVGDRPIALKARMPTAVPPSSGHIVARTTALAAVSAGSPFCIRTRMPSVTTMALSTSMPSAMMSAPSEMRCIAMPACHIAISVPATVSTSTMPMIRPLRSPMKISRTTTTMATAPARLATKLSTAARTESDWYDTTFRSMPTGRWPSSCASRCLTASPICTTLPPSTLEIPRPMAGRPSCRISTAGGVVYSRRMSAMSSRRTRPLLASPATTRLFSVCTDSTLASGWIGSRSAPARTLPAGLMTFCARSVAYTWSSGIPNWAARAREISTNSASLRSPSSATRATPGTSTSSRRRKSA